MSAKASRANFNKIITEVAKGLLAFVFKEVKQRKWKLAYLDTRYRAQSHSMVKQLYL